MKVTNNERDIIEKVAILSGQDYQTVKKTFKGFVSALLMELYTTQESSNGSKEREVQIELPFFGTVAISYKRKMVRKRYDVEEDIKVTPCNYFHNTLVRIENKEKTELQESLEYEIFKELKGKLSL